MNIEEITERSQVFSEHLAQIKSEQDPGFTFYPYDSFGVFQHLREIFRNKDFDLHRLAGSGPILDIGAGDGSVSFFLESLGFRVVAIDHPLTNWNGMRGIHYLKRRLKSSIEIVPAHLDSQFDLGNQRYGLALLLGVLYHVQNPFYVMANIARHAEYCLLSTRVARYSYNQWLNYHSEPMAYLVDERETNNDPTNYWIFSETGLRRLLKRTHWNVCEFASFGNRESSDPVTADGDERAYALAKSERPPVELLDGWYQQEADGWRWVRREFAARFLAPAGGSEPLILRLNLAVPELLIARLGSVGINASVNGVELGPENYVTAGRYEYVRKMPAEARNGTSGLTVTFSVDGALPPDDQDLRERGLIVLSLVLD